MLEEPPPPRRARGEALTEALREDLDLFAIQDLNERIELLEAEIRRVRDQIERKQAGREAADALFKR
ncbi:MAG TPA: DUF1192 domain-containing protein [Caulobacteraceae bacterium]|jgi:uncharacterized small protein (DUF1192 family)|nr:DUF1192 domain-containing protein [Caulobacteraceae bacterium]